MCVVIFVTKQMESHPSKRHKLTIAFKSLHTWTSQVDHVWSKYHKMIRIKYECTISKLIKSVWRTIKIGQNQNQLKHGQRQNTKNLIAWE